MAEFSSSPVSSINSSARLRRLGAIVVWVIFLSGVVFRVAEYAADRSLWLDEAALAKNILQQPISNLAAGRLGDSQVAPPGFSLSVRAVTALGGDGEPMLRLVPFMAGVTVLALVTLLAWRRLGPVGASATVALTAWSWPLIYYTNECKQYSTDALIAVLLFGLARKIMGQPLTTQRALAVGLAGWVALFFSQPALFGLAALGLFGVTLAAINKNWTEVARWSVVGVGWLSFFALLMWLSFDSTLGNSTLFTYHQNAFLRLWPLAEAWPVWHDTILGDWITATAETWKIWLGLLALGLWAGWQKHRRETVFIGLAILCVAGASLLQVYPLAVRLVLFLFPLLFWLIGQGAAWLAGLAQGRVTWLVAALLLWAAWPMERDGVAGARHPYAPEHLRPVAATLAQKVRPGDVVLVFDLTREAFGYYWPRMTHADVPVHAVIFEHDEPMLAATMAAKIAPFLDKNPTRVWLVATHDTLGAAPENLRTLVAVLRQRYPGAADFAPPGGTAQGVVFYQAGAEPK
jgi:hypothetical protein